MSDKCKPLRFGMSHAVLVRVWSSFSLAFVILLNVSLCRDSIQQCTEWCEVLLLCKYLRHPFHPLNKQTCVALQSRCLDIRKSRQGRTFLQPVNQVCSWSLCLLIPLKRSLCPHSPSHLSKPDYWLSIQTQSLLLIRTNLLVIEHTSSLLRPAKTGADSP